MLEERETSSASMPSTPPASSASSSPPSQSPVTAAVGTPTPVATLPFNQTQLLPIFGWTLQSPTYLPGSTTPIYVPSTLLSYVGLSSSPGQTTTSSSPSSSSSQNNSQPGANQFNSTFPTSRNGSSLSNGASPTAARPSSSRSSGNLPNGTVAGIAIGVATFASIVTFLIAFFIMRSRRSRSYSKHSHGDANKSGAIPSNTMSDKEKRSQSTNHELSQPSLAATWNSKLDSYLPPSEDDYTIQNDISGVLDQISIHVENFYKSSTSTVSKEVRAELKNFDLPDSPPLPELLSEASNSLLVIQYCLTRQILERTSQNGDIGTTFLPIDFVTLPSTLERLKAQKDDKPRMFEEAFSRWRVLSAYLYRDSSSDSVYVSTRDERIDTFVRSVSRAFYPWAKPGKDRSQLTRHLTSIIQNAIEKGILLFSQPSMFEFNWGTCYDPKKRQLVVSPALVKVADENAQKLQKPQNMISQNVVII